MAFRSNHRFPVSLLAYHHVAEKRGFPATRVSCSQFESQMTALKERGFRTVGPEALLNPALLPGPLLCITFDDSYDSVHRFALPLLKSLEYTATLFIISDFMGKPNTWDVQVGRVATHMSADQIRSALNNGFSIGSHSRTHPDLNSLSDPPLKEELSGSKKALEDAFGVPVDFFAYPFGRFNGRVKAAVRESGYKAAFTISRPLFSSAFDPFAMPVTGIYSVDSRASFLIKIQRNGFIWVQDMKDKIINRFASGAALVKGNRA